MLTPQKTKCILSPIGLVVFSNLHLFHLTKIKKVFSSHVMWLSAKVWLFRLNDFHPHEMWCSQYYFSSSFIIYLVLISHPFIHLPQIIWELHFFVVYSETYLFHSFILFFSFFLSTMWVKVDFSCTSLLDITFSSNPPHRLLDKVSSSINHKSMDYRQWIKRGLVFVKFLQMNKAQRVFKIGSHTHQVGQKRDICQLVIHSQKLPKIIS